MDSIPQHLRMPDSDADQRTLALLCAWARNRGGRLLVVDDSPTNRMVIAGILRNVGFSVEEAIGGAEAISAVRDGRTLVDAVLMDVAMPEVDGLMATAAIRKLPGSRGAVPIIAVTANVQPEYRVLCAECGMDDFLPKPVRKDHLLAALRRLLPA